VGRISLFGTADHVDSCGHFSGRDHDRFAAMGLTPVPAQVIRTALIKECSLNLECQAIQTVNLGSHDLFLGKVVAARIEDWTAPS
jgi:flavin reductase (DIM6/NTAB) family NADH-FMN oxidoreductase RutF